MYHVEMRMGMSVVREFNLGEERLWLEILRPLMAGQDFMHEGHEFSPRQTRLKVYEGPELRPDQLGMGRGWSNVERSAHDVTERVLARAREHVSAGGAPGPTSAGAVAPEAASAGVPAPGAASAGVADLLRERLIGRLSAGPITAPEVLATAAELMPGGSEPERLAAAQQAIWALLDRELAQLAPSGR
jgi:hypothetical protein